MHEALIKSFGFQRAGSCNCGGARNEIYKRDNYQLYYRKRKQMFRIKKRNDIIVPVTSIINLETELKKLFPNAMAVAEEKV